MNEVFTYSFDGQFKELTRSFPKKHVTQVEQFESYIVNEKSPVVGAIKNESLLPMQVYLEDQTYVSVIGNDETTVSVFYAYYMRNAVKSYSAYSDIDLTFFEDGYNHDVDFENVHISFVLPDDVGEDHIYGFMHDRHGTVQKYHSNGVVFETMKATAYTETSTRLLFPSTIMTEQTKEKVPAPLDAVIAQEEKNLQSQQSKLAKIPIISKVNRTTGLLFLLLGMGMLLLLPQRWFLLRGRLDTVLEADPLYLFFIDQNGKWHPKSFLAGLFSMVENGHANVALEPSDIRYQNTPQVGKDTLAFRLNEGNEERSAHENALVNWLFQSEQSTGERKFHLHDVAGAKQGERDAKRQKYYFDKYKRFIEKDRNWHKEVNRLLKESGAFTTFVPRLVKIIVLIAIVVLTTATYVVDLQKTESILLFLGGSTVMFFSVIWLPRKRWIQVLYFIFLFYLIVDIVDGKLSFSLFVVYVGGLLLYWATPHAIVTSIYALNVKRGIRSFRSQVKRGLPRALSQADREQWLIRAYLLNKSKSKLPFANEDLPSTIPLAPMFKSGIDPFFFVRKTWKWTKSGGSGGANSRTGGFSGGGGGGGGGGAGAR